MKWAILILVLVCWSGELHAKINPPKPGVVVRSIESTKYKCGSPLCEEYVLAQDRAESLKRALAAAKREAAALKKRCRRECRTWEPPTD